MCVGFGLNTAATLKWCYDVKILDDLGDLADISVF